MRQIVGADTLAFLSIDGLYRAMGEAGRDPANPKFTDHCFTGDYPTPLTDLTRTEIAPQSSCRCWPRRASRHSRRAAPKSISRRDSAHIGQADAAALHACATFIAQSMISASRPCRRGKMSTATRPTTSPSSPAPRAASARHGAGTGEGQARMSSRSPAPPAAWKNSTTKSRSSAARRRWCPRTCASSTISTAWVRRSTSASAARYSGRQCRAARRPRLRRSACRSEELGTRVDRGQRHSELST